MFRNRLTTAQHYYHWTDLFTRIVNNQMGTSPDWAQEIAKEWMTRQVEKMSNTKQTTLLVTDSGLGGLSVCAGMAAKICGRCPVRPGPPGLFSMPGRNSIKATTTTRTRRIGPRYSTMPWKPWPGSIPTRFFIACNTLSVIYPFTRFAKETTIPVTGIVDYGVEMIFDALTRDPDASAVIFATPATIHENSHKKELVDRGIDPDRVITQGCLNLAGKIERSPFQR